MSAKVIKNITKIPKENILYVYQIKIETQIYHKMGVENLKNIDFDLGEIPALDFI